MTTNIRLVALRCLECSQPISGDKRSLFLFCTECGSGFEVVRHEELVKIPVYFAKHNKQSEDFLPFWAFDATLQLTKREAKGGFFSSPKGLIQLFEKQNAIRFYVGAFQKDLSPDTPAALQLTLEQPNLEYLHAQKKLPVVQISQEDAKKIADFLLLTSEIEQKDTMRDLEYELKLQNPMLIAITL